jgi:N6-adenosine-specific RNA methylase IME4
VGCLSDKGFIFLWVINSQIEFGFKCLQKWGYTYVDRVRVSPTPKIREKRIQAINIFYY